MKCPHCDAYDSRVVDTRSTGDGIRRRRECQVCARRFTTYEQVAAALHIVKSDGRREPYDRQKLTEGIRIACAKRPIPVGDIERTVSQIEDHLLGWGKAELSSRVVGECVLSQLRELDEVGYIRFATVYLELKDLEAVRDEIDQLLADQERPRP